MTLRLEAAFQAFMAQVHPDGVPPHQLASMRMAFYGGATEVLSTCAQIGDGEITEDAGIELLDELIGEVEAFAAACDAGAAAADGGRPM